MTLLRILAAAFLVSTAACAAPSSGDAGEPTDSADSELSSVSFFTRAPMSGHRLEAFRRALEDGDMGHVWVRNQGTVTGMQWEGKGEGASLVRAALRSLGRRGARDVKLTTDLEGALDTVGLEESSPDAATAQERAKILDALRDIAKTRDVTVFTATLHDAPDMYWENALVVIDEDNKQLIIATGGFGT